MGDRIDEPLSDDDRRLLVTLLMQQVPAREPPNAQIVRLISQLSGVDTELVCRRAYPSRTGLFDRLQRDDRMKSYEVAVEMAVRRTLRITAPDGEYARQVAAGILKFLAEGIGELSSFLKWTDGRVAYRPMPVETILSEPAPVIGEPFEIPDGEIAGGEPVPPA
jgi:hypothetical protein